MIRGGEEDDSYSASDPNLQRWVNPTIYWGMIGVYEKAFGEISPDASDNVYMGFRRLSMALNMESEPWLSSSAASCGGTNNACL
jgi:uncharacterized protein (DUF2236 family)